MSLTPGTLLGHYEIAAALGAGGMGEVYRARDTKLDRDVAIKLLPDELADNPERLARFEREAKSLAALNHPNIATVHGFEHDEAKGTHFLVMELVEGDDLADRIARDRMPLDDAIPLFVQIAEGLEAAHEKGIIHRDLKPANIKVGPDGRVKILDFGLAKALEAPGTPSTPSLSQSPTMTAAATQHGEIMGTAAYMSPEQAKGGTVDRRTDVWAFACCFFEALSGRRAFAGDSAAETIAAVIEREPAWDLLPRECPSGVLRLLRRGLAKDPRRRLHDLADARLELEDPDLAFVESPSGAVRTSSLAGAAVVVAVLGALAGWLAASLGSDSETPAHPFQLSVTLPSSAALKVDNGAPALSLSPDGRSLVYVGENAEGTQAYLRELDSFDVEALAGTEGAEEVAFSPDGRSIAFATRSAVLRMNLDDRSATIVAPIRRTQHGHSFGLAWGADDVLYFSDFQGIWRISATTGETVEMNLPAFATYPQALPNGDLLYTQNLGTSSRSRISVWSQSSGESRVVVESGYQGLYLPNGHLLFVRMHEVFLATFDPVRDESSGPAVRVLEDAFVDLWGAAPIAVAASGAVSYVVDRPRTRLIRLGLDGRVTPLSENQAGWNFARLSPDGDQVALTVARGSEHAAKIWDLTLENLRTVVDGITDVPIWPPDGRSLVFNMTTGDSWSLFRGNVGGTSAIEQLTTSDIFDLPTSISPDGKTLLFTRAIPGKSIDVYTLDLESLQAEPFISTANGESEARFSPDGRYVAYSVSEGGVAEVYVVDYADPDQDWKISDGGGWDALWAPDGTALYYRNGRDIMRVELAAGNGFLPQRPEVLFRGPDLGNPKHYRSWDISSDGQSFVAIERVVQPTELHIDSDWLTKAKRLAPSTR